MKRSDMISAMVKFAENSNIDIDSQLYKDFHETIFCLWTDNIQDDNDNEVGEE